MTHGSSGAGFRATPAEKNNRLFGCHFLGDPGQVSSIGNRFQIHGNDINVVFIAEVFQQVIFIDIAFVSNGTHLIDIQTFISDEIRGHPGSQDTGLPDKHHVPPWDFFNYRINGCHDIAGYNAGAVRPHDPDIVFLGDIDDLVLNDLAFPTHFTESGGFNNDCFNAFLGALFYCCKGNFRCRKHRDNEVNLTRYFCYAAIHLISQYLV